MNDNVFYDLIEDKTIVVTGAVGSIGRALVKKILQYNPKQLRAFDQDETGLVFLEDELDHPDNFRPLIGNIREYDRVKTALNNADIVINAAAMKHVAISEYNPFEAVLTNVIGVKNVINASLKNNVKLVVQTSTDKAAAPANTMGATKLLAEKLIIAANYSKGPVETILSAVRFGNVMGTRGSVIPRVLKRIKAGLPIIVSDMNMTRYMMTEEDAVRLILEAASKQVGGETFVLKMKAIRLGDLIDLIIEWYHQNFNGPEPIIKKIGLFPGEKTYEELVSEDEAQNTLDLEEMLILLPSIRQLKARILKKYFNISPGLSKAYRSDNEKVIPKSELRDIVYKILNRLY